MFSRIFIERPRLASVIAIIMILGGLIAIFNIPVAENPSISPPVIRVSAQYPGANAQTVQDTVAAPIEQEINGVEDMLYMESTSSNTGTYSLEVTFEVDSNPDIDQVNVQNRLQLAKSQLPQAVLDQGIDVRRRSSNMLGVITFTSPQGKRSNRFISSYVRRAIMESMVRVQGVSDVFIYGDEYSMRIWMKPDKLAALGLSAQDVIKAIREQSTQATVGSVGTAPSTPGQKMQYSLVAKGRLQNAEEFSNIIVRQNEKGGVVRVKDVAKVELGSKSYSTDTMVNNKTAVGMAIYRSTEANSLDTMTKVRKELKHIDLPEGMSYNVMYDTTDYVQEAIKEIVFTLGLTFLLVVAVIFVFLQDWRSTLIPTAAIPVSLIGTFAALLTMGFTANTLTLFALILAIGLVVDDAIIVVENIHRVMHEEKLDRKSAAIKGMREVTGPIVATTLVLLAVFVPVTFMPGITGLLYKQFGITLCVAVVLSAINSLTLSPALCALFLKETKSPKHGPFAWFNKSMGCSTNIYTSTVGWLLRHMVVAMGIFVLVLGGTGLLFQQLPTSFIPQEDKGAFFNDLQLPEGASLRRTKEVQKRLTKTLEHTEGVEDVLAVSGFSMLSGRAENVGFLICDLKPWEERTTPNQQLNAIINKARKKYQGITTANVFPFTPPPIQGLGNTGGFDLRLEAFQGQSPRKMVQAARSLIIAANQEPSIARAYTTYSANTPQIYVHLDRTRLKNLGIPVSRVFATLQGQLGSRYVNDFNMYGRTYQVKVRAEDSARMTREDIKNLYVTNNQGKEIPMSNLVDLSTTLGPKLIKRYNLFPSIAIKGNPAPGYSSGQAMQTMKRLVEEKLPGGYTSEWSGMSFQEQKASGSVIYLFALAIFFAYLFLVGLYESWNIPLSVMLSVMVAACGGLAGVWLAGIPLSIYAQIGAVLLVALAAKNAILIVEFARDRRQESGSAYQAALEGARIRFRPVLMTAFTFILGVAPLVVATGAGAASRRHIGTMVFSGMIAATTVGILIIPALYFLFQRTREKARNLNSKDGGNSY